MSTETISYRGQLVVNTCWCGMRHAIPQELYDLQHRQHRDGWEQQTIYCPLGHGYSIAGKGEAETLRKQLERERDRAARLVAAVADSTTRSARCARQG